MTALINLRGVSRLDDNLPCSLEVTDDIVCNEHSPTRRMTLGLLEVFEKPQWKWQKNPMHEFVVADKISWLEG